MARRRSVSPHRTLLGTAVTVLVAVLVWFFTDDSNGSDGSPARESAAADADVASTVVRNEPDETPLATAPRSTTAATTATASPERTDPVVADGFDTIDAADLPSEGRDTLELIDGGGPFPYDQDGGTFQNREGILPDRPPGYYQEYTVETPGSDDRGARRIITGDQGEIYYTEDHYDSFRVVLR